VIADDSDMGMLICESLNATGWFRAEQVQDSRAGLEAWKRQPYHLLIADYTMPGSNRDKMFTALRESIGGIPAILMSGHPAFDENRGNAAAFLTKPFPMSQLLRETAKVLRAGASMVNAYGDGGA
jgi:DNA-binding NtrC family response regulator